MRPTATVLPPIKECSLSAELDMRGSSPMAAKDRKNLVRAFWDFFVLFSGISTASNLSRTQTRPVRSRGLFLFRKSANEPAGPAPNDPTQG